MVAETGKPPNRLERRKARTRAALIDAAQQLLADGRPDAPIQDITQAADVGLGSFYNHFADRDHLFQAAIVAAMDRLGTTFEALAEDLDDPAEVFARSYRLFGRIHRREPTLSKVLLNNWASPIIGAEKGLAPRARRDIVAAVDAGRFAVHDLDLTMAIVTGAAMSLGRLLHEQPHRDDADAVDQLTEDILRTLGLPGPEAADISHRPLPSLDANPHH